MGFKVGTWEKRRAKLLLVESRVLEAPRGRGWRKHIPNGGHRPGNTRLVRVRCSMFNALACGQARGVRDVVEVEVEVETRSQSACGQIERSNMLRAGDVQAGHTRQGALAPGDPSQCMQPRKLKNACFAPPSVEQGHHSVERSSHPGKLAGFRAYMRTSQWLHVVCVRT